MQVGSRTDMTRDGCARCGTHLEGDMDFCPSCGLPRGATMPAVPAVVSPWEQPMAQGPVPQWAAPPPIPMGTAPARLPRNPRQMASTAAAVLMLLSGIFAFIFGSYILVQDAFADTWIGPNQRETAMIPEPFFIGIVLVLGFAMSIAGAYAALRLVRFELALAAPVLLIVGYVVVWIYETFLLIFLVEILIMAMIALILLFHARPAFLGTGGPGQAPTAVPPPPDGERA